MLDKVSLMKAVALANVPTLACTLVHLTGDVRWIRPPFLFSRVRGLDDNDTGGLSQSLQEEIRKAAVAAISDWFAGQPEALPNPSDELLLEMMSASLGENIPSTYGAMIRHELRLPPKEQREESPPVGKPPREFRALIIGGGISALCAAVELRAAGISYTIVERREALGGVWFENRYPGAACDVPSHLYSFSFAPAQWSRYFAGSREIHEYLEHVAVSHGILPHIRFGLEAVEARYDEATEEWETLVMDAAGELETLRSSIVISCVGAFNKPRIPDVPGLGLFKGPSVHTARYPEEGLDLSGKNVILIGNGASAMQVAPAIADEVRSLTIVQRSRQWAAPFAKFKQEIPQPLRELMDTLPVYRLWYRLRLSWAFNDKLYEALQHDPEWQGNGRSINAINDAHRKQLTEYITSELGKARHLLPEVLPEFPPFSKRMLLDNGWFRTLARQNVKLVTAGVSEVLEDGIVTTDGEHHAAEVLIWATGFDVVNLLAPLRVRGVDDRDLHADWDGDDARAYLGTVVPGYPNFFCLYGPNTQFGHGGSLITVLERQMHYVMSLLRQMFEGGIATVDVRKEVYDAYNEAVDRAHDRMIWKVSGVSTYFQNSKGRIVVNNPFRILDFWNMTERADLTEYHCSTGRGRKNGDAPAEEAAHG